MAGAGFLLNNEMDDFAAKPGTPNMYGLVQGEANAIAPGKRMLSAMTPTIVLDADANPPPSFSLPITSTDAALAAVSIASMTAMNPWVSIIPMANGTLAARVAPCFVRKMNHVLFDQHIKFSRRNHRRRLRVCWGMQ